MTTTSNVPGIIMVDDNTLATAAMERRFAGADGLRWLGATSNAATALALIQDCFPEVVLLDVDMPGTDTFKLLEYITARCPSTAVVMFSGLDQPELIEKALDLGASGYIHKDEPTAVLVELCAKAARGECVLSPLASRTYMHWANPHAA